MSEYPAWWPKPRETQCCTLSHVLHEVCGHATQNLNSIKHVGVSQRNDQWRVMPSADAEREVKEAHSSCPCLKTLYLIQRGQCSKCDYYQQVPPRRRSFFDHLTGKRDATLADRLDHSQILSPKRQEQREERLLKWRLEIEQQTIRHKHFFDESREPRVSERKAAFEQGYAALRAQEEQDSIPFQDRVFVYDEKARYNEILSRIDPESQGLGTKCGSCNRYYESDTELKKLPCGHAIHDSCFKRLYCSTIRQDFRCPVCERKFRVLVKPKF